MGDDGFTLGLLVSGFVIFLAVQIAESICQTENDVADCEWSQSPFMPVLPESRK